LRPAHAKERFERYDPLANSLSEADARLLIANQEGYAYWNKYESYLHLDPAVQNVIQAARTGDLPRLGELLQADPAAANPKWVPGFRPPDPIPNDSVPLFCISEGVFRGTNLKGQEYEITRALINAGGDPEIAGGLPLTSALSFHAVRVVEALLDSGAAVALPIPTASSANCAASPLYGVSARLPTSSARRYTSPAITTGWKSRTSLFPVARTSMPSFPASISRGLYCIELSRSSRVSTPHGRRRSGYGRLSSFCSIAAPASRSATGNTAARLSVGPISVAGTTFSIGSSTAPEYMTPSPATVPGESANC
jgi:hypothetical protein